MFDQLRRKKAQLALLCSRRRVHIPLLLRRRRVVPDCRLPGTQEVQVVHDTAQEHQVAEGQKVRGIYKELDAHR